MGRSSQVAAAGYARSVQCRTVLVKIQVKEGFFAVVCGETSTSPTAGVFLFCKSVLRYGAS